MLADEMGLGKTVQAIAAADMLGLRKVLVLTPKSALYNWRDEFRRWSVYERETVLHRMSFKKWPEATELLIATPGMIHNPVFVKRAIRHGFDVVIADEADAFKNRDAKQTQAFYGMEFDGGEGSLVSAAPRTWLLTGTPLPNHLGDMWTHLHALTPEVLTGANAEPMRYMTFLRRYTVLQSSRYGGPKPVRNNPATVNEARVNLLQPFMLRRRLRDVLPDLPFFHTGVQALPDHGVRDALTRMESELDPDLVAKLRQLDESPDPAKLLAHLKATEPHLARLRRLTGLLKVDMAADVVEQALGETDRKIIVFVQHLDVLSALREKFTARGIETVTIDGSVSAKDRSEIVTRFQDDPLPRVFLGQIQACCTAITLTQATRVYFVEASWSPRDISQASCRALRIGQDQDVHVRFLVLENSVDQQVTKVLVRKSGMINELLRQG